MPRVYIIILNYKKWADTVECLETLFRSLYDNFCVIVIDNNSQNDSLQHLMHWAQTDTTFTNRLSVFTKDIFKPVSYNFFYEDEFNSQIPAILPRLVFIQNKENKGFAGGINAVLDLLRKEEAYTWLLNPDMIVEESTLPELAEFAGKSPATSIIGSVIKFYTDPAQIHLYAGGRINFNSGTIEMIRTKSELSSLDYISGGSLFTHAGNFGKLGLLPADYFLYWEETDWCYHAKQKGYSLCLCEKAICYDKVSSTIGKDFLADYYYTRNGLIFLSKYKKGKTAVALFFGIFRFMKRIVAGQPGRAKGVYKGMLSFLNKNKHAYK